MELKNYMEIVAFETLEKAWQDKKDICKCRRCKLDILCWVLNRLPAKYMVSEHGRIHTKLQETVIQFQVDVLQTVLKAIELVSKKPHHLP